MIELAAATRTVCRAVDTDDTDDTKTSSSNESDPFDAMAVRTHPCTHPKTKLIIDLAARVYNNGLVLL